MYSSTDSSIGGIGVSGESGYTVYDRNEEQQVVGAFSCREIQITDNKSNGRGHDAMGKMHEALRLRSLQEILCECVVTNILQ